MAELRTDIPHGVYRAADGVSKSDLDLIHQSPALLEWSRNCPTDPEAPTAADLGKAFETRLLEPERWEAEYVIEPQVNRRANAGKEKLEKFHEENEGKEIITAEQDRQIEYMVGSVWAHPMARRILEAPGLMVQPSCWWQDSFSGLQCKCRPDLLVPSPPILTDLKITGDLSKFRWSIKDYRYHCQSSMYSDGLYHWFGEQPWFFFIVVSSTRSLGRYPCHVFDLSPDDIQEGRNEYLEDLMTLKECLETGIWEHVERISLPQRKWA